MENTNTTGIGLGCVTFGREIDAKTSFELMDYAWSEGVRLFDTAAVYGNGMSESIIGQWLSERNLKDGEVKIATKILPPYDTSTIRYAVEASLKRLGINIIDLLYFHRWDEQLTNPTPWLALNQLVNEGKIRSIGVSNFNVNQLEAAIKLLSHIDSVKLSFIQNNHNLAVREITEDVKKICRNNNIRIVTYSPLGAGFLTGKHLQGVQRNSRFEILPGHQDVYFNAQSQARLHKLIEVATRTGLAPELLALAWAIHQPGIDSVLVGGRSVNHLKLITRAIEFYSPEIFAELEAV